MLYRTNLPMWERAARLAAAALSGFCAQQFWGTPVGYAFGAFAVVTALTAFFGFCPMCSLAGRKIAARANEKT